MTDKASIDPAAFAGAEWIGGPGNAFCRKEFILPGPVVSARMRVVADPHSYAIDYWQIPVGPFQYEHALLGGSLIKYRVFCNGSLVAVGPFRPIQDGVPVVQEYPIAPWLGEGTNTLAVLSRGEKKGFALVLEGECADGRQFRIVTSADWRQRDANTVYRPVCWECQAIDHAEKGGPGPGEYPEHIDGRVYPQGWREDGFDDSAWTPAETFGTVEEACEICANPPYEIARIRPVRVNALGKGNYLVDFGQEIFAGVELTGPQGGGAVELRLGEERLPNGHVRYLLRTENCYQERWTFAPDSEPLSHFGLRMFRYAEVAGWTGKFSEDALTAIRVRAPFDDTASEFHCDQAALEEVWQLCKNSVAYATADIYTDCLTRERLAYEADTYVAMLTQFATEGSWLTAKRTLSYLAGHPNWPCEWRQMFIPLFHEYLLHSGDRDFVDAHYTFLKETSLHTLMKDGVIPEFPRECIVDWPAACRDGFVFGSGNAVANAFAYWDLVLLTRVAGWLGRSGDAGNFAAAAEELRAGFNRHLFDEAKGLYRDGLGIDHHSFHANLFALRFGLVPQERVQSCLEFLKGKGMACGVFPSQFLLETLFMYGADTAAVKLITSEGPCSWLEMIRAGATITTESWLTGAKENMSWAHPWGSGPANVIVRHLFGLRPVAPGWSEYVFDPRPGGLGYGDLRVRTPRGVIHAGFRRKEGTYESFCSERSGSPGEGASEQQIPLTVMC